MRRPWPIKGCCTIGKKIPNNGIVKIILKRIEVVSFMDNSASFVDVVEIFRRVAEI
jgi:hypothetical protein